MINGIRVRFLDETGPALGTEQDALDLIGDTYGEEIDAIAIPASRLTPGFFDLSTKIAGLFIQKLQNYSLRLIVLGDISSVMARSKALNDFVGETNRVGHHFFAPDRATLESQFGRRA